VNSPANVHRVALKPRRALPFFSRHPWVFEGAIDAVTDGILAGDVVAVEDHLGRFIAYGLFNPQSKITVRLYSWDQNVPLDDTFWTRRINGAIDLRNRLGLVSSETAGFRTACGTELLRDSVPLPCPPHLTPDDDVSSHHACRLIFSEADGLSGLTVDKYGDWLLVQWSSLALSKRQDWILQVLRDRLNPKGIWLRTEKGIRDAEGLELRDGLIDGQPPPRPLIIVENRVRFAVDLTEGQKTGFFLDQRENRLRVSELVRGHRVLDVCCYSGGFSLNGLVNGGVREVVALDVSESALELARTNAELNGVSDRMRLKRSDCFKGLEELAASGDSFDTVILDPPKLARNRQGLDSALKGYYSLNRSAMRLLRPGGWLVTCSCSGSVTLEMFQEMLAKAALHENRSLQILETRGPAMDHPTSITCPETVYLKCLICHVT